MELKKSNDIHYFTAGEGKPLYLIHGFPDCPENFEHQIKFFAGEGFQVIAPYLPGYHPEGFRHLPDFKNFRNIH